MYIKKGCCPALTSATKRDMLDKHTLYTVQPRNSKRRLNQETLVTICLYVSWMCWCSKAIFLKGTRPFITWKENNEKWIKAVWAFTHVCLFLYFFLFHQMFDVLIKMTNRNDHKALYLSVCLSIYLSIYKLLYKTSNTKIKRFIRYLSGKFCHCDIW